MESQNRPPIVTVLGHVDHGKTTLLDAIRKTSVALAEAGGITQSIGASSITTKSGKRITFIDTPGHAAFSKMRSRGARVADIAVLVVSADDGVKPQTQEALSAIRDADIPFVVAITKTDLPSADPESVKGQLTKEGVTFEGKGGDTPALEISAKTGKGIEDLVETILLMAEVHEVKADKASPLQAIVIETSKDKRGLLASVIVRNGVLKVGEVVYADNIASKVRAIFNDKGVSVKEIFPGESAQILGFEKLPEVGSEILPSPKEILTKTESNMAEIKEGDLPLFVKAQTKGGLEALLASLPQGTYVVKSGVGDVNESDVLDAKASKASIFAFESKVPPSVHRLAEAEGVRIERFSIIYELIERIGEIVKKGIVETLGKAQILAIFPFNNKKVAGSKVSEGRIAKSDNLLLLRDEKEFAKAKAISMKRGRQELSEAKAGEEFGVIFDKDIDFKIGDVILAVK